MADTMSQFLYKLIQRLGLLLLHTLPGPKKHKYFLVEVHCQTFTWTNKSKWERVEDAQ